MAFDTVIQQGRFTSNGLRRQIEIRSDVDWMWVYNETQIAAQNNVGVQYYWQRGFADGTGWRYFKSGGADTLNLLNLASPLGFSLLDTSANPVNAAIAVTASSNATQPVVNTGNTAGLEAGDVVRLVNVAGVPNLGGIDFQIDTVVANVSFRIANALANVPGAVGGAGFYRKIDFDPIYYPRRRFIVNVTQATNAVITTSVDHGFTVGQEIRFSIPADFAMVELDGLAGTITAVTASTFTVDIDTSGFTAFAYPTAAGFTSATFAQAVPFGEDVGQARTSNVDELGDATDNVAIIGMSLAGGADSPGGASSDVMYWVAGKSFSVDNQ